MLTQARPLIAMLTFSALLVGLLSVRPGSVDAQAAGTVTWNQYNVTIQVQGDGSFNVSERMEVAFSGEHEFTFGYADIPLDRVEGISNVRISEESGTETVSFREVEQTFGHPPEGTYYSDRRDDRLYVEYGFSPTSNTTRTFVLSYQAAGALRVYRDETPPNEQVYWNAIAKEVTGVGPVRRASVTIVLPEAVPLDQVVLGEDTTGNPTDHTTDGQTWTWEKTGLGSGDEFTVRMQFPPITSASAPSWQAADDERRADDERNDRWRIRLAAIAAVLGLGGLSGGGLYLARLYQKNGRDPHVGLIAEILTTPPDDLPPGLVGTLIDETADTKEIVATMIDLANRGVLEIEQTDKADFDVRLLQPIDLPTAHEQLVLDALFPGGRVGEVNTLKKARVKLSKQADSIKARMYDELVTRGHFEYSPKNVRSRWAAAGAGMIAAGIVLAVVGARSSMFVIAAIVIGVVVAILGLAVMIVGNAMPRKTVNGAESAARWKAFRRYLEELESFKAGEAISSDPDLFERYLPFATAFGIDSKWVKRFEQTNARAPIWYVPIGGTGRSSGTSPRSGDGGGGLNIPSAQGMSNSAFVSLAAASAGMSSFLNSAATAFTPQSSSGGSGGGFSGGGGGGGGGGSGGRGFG